ncbi:MAG: hypothetical protein ACU0BS_14250, partial [Hasllibacter sp.]
SRVRPATLAPDAGGSATRASWERPTLETSCRARLDGALRAARERAALGLPAAVGARDYSLYDFRIHAGTGEPYLLEACSFWTFTPFSVISRMLAAEGVDLDRATARIWARAAARGGAVPQAA